MAIVKKATTILPTFISFMSKGVNREKRPVGLTKFSLQKEENEV